MVARSLILRREQRNGFEPSHPQMAGGANVEPLLIPRVNRWQPMTRRQRSRLSAAAGEKCITAD
jgi:hypothetical protein